MRIFCLPPDLSAITLVSAEALAKAGPSFMCSSSPCTALDPTSGSAAASSKDTDLGLSETLAAFATANSAYAPDPPFKIKADPYASSPTLNSETPSPSSVTTPAKSPPNTAGNWIGLHSLRYPARSFQSTGLILEAYTSTSTCPFFGDGLEISRSSKTSLPPYVFICTAFIH